MQKYGNQQPDGGQANPYTLDQSNTIDPVIPQTRKAKWLIALICALILLVTILITLGVLKAMKKPETKKSLDNTMAVIATDAKLQDVQLMVNVQGEARPRTEIDLVPEVAGKIVYVSPNFIEGGIFKQGETLLQIDDSDYKVAVIRAQASVAQAEQALVREKAEGEIARQDWEELGSGDPSALTLRKPQLQQAQASLSAAKAELQQANLQLTRTAVKAPFDGRVRNKASDLGQYVGPGARLGRIFSTDITEVRLALTDSDLSKLDLPIAYVANSVDVAPSVKLSAVIAGQTRVWNGKIMRTDSTYDTQTRAIYAIAEVFDPYNSGAAEGGFPLAPGLFVDAEIAGYQLEQVIVLPRDGLRPDDKVYVVDLEGNATVKDAIVIDTNSERAVLKSGINQGDLVILSPLEKSAISRTFKVLNADDPNEVLVDPPTPKEESNSDDEEQEQSDEKEKDAESK